MSVKRRNLVITIVFCALGVPLVFEPWPWPLVGLGIASCAIFIVKD